MIQRWELKNINEGVGYTDMEMAQDEDGVYVKYSDFLRVVDSLLTTLNKIANWEFDIMGDCVADATRLAHNAVEQARHYK